MAVKSISKSLLKITEKLELKLSVTILDNQRNNSLYSYYNASYNNSYFIVNISSFVSIRYKDKSGEWDRNKSIKINDNNLYQLITGLRRAKNNIYHPQLFVYHDNDDISVNVDVATKQSVFIDNLIDYTLNIVPSVIYDTDEKAMVGVMLYINNSEYCVDLSIDEFETLVYFFERLNIGTETQTVVNMFLIEQMSQMVNKMNDGQRNVDEQPQPTKTLNSGNTKRVILFKDDDTPTKEVGVTGHIHKRNKPRTLEDL